jgi:hypothetical protein
MTKRRLMPPGQLSLGLIDDAEAMRDALVVHLQVVRRRARFIREMGMAHGAARIDLAVVDEHLDGYEIKSSRDDLRRLAGQTIAYGRVFDRLTLVGTARHLVAAERAVPSWWGLAVVDVGVPSVESIRPASANPGADVASVARLLWRSELVGILQQRTGQLHPEANALLRQRLVGELGPEEVRAVVRRCLIAREGWPAAGKCG